MASRVFFYALIALCLLVFSVDAGVLLKNRHHTFHSFTEKQQQKQSGRLSAPGPAQEQWYEQQRVDHFDNTNTATWKQRFFANDTFFNRAMNGPVFLMIGAEGPLSAGTVADRMVLTQYASMFGALVVAVEHRFYGKSMPLPDLSTKNLRFLSSQQALSDVAQFIPFIRQKYNVPAGSKVIVFGGSYGGNLSAWFRGWYPHLAAGSLASSAPVRAQLNFHEYMDVVARSVGPRCNSRVRAATDALEKLVATADGRKQANSMFKTCQWFKSESSADDIAMFFSSITDPVCGVVQYSGDNVNYQPYDIAAMCNAMEVDADPLTSYVKFINDYNAKTQGCVVTQYQEYIKEMRVTTPFPDNSGAAGRAWTWQTCTEFGYYQSAEGHDQPFSNAITQKWFEQQCNDIFDTPYLPDQSRIDWSNTFYGNDTPKSTNVIFTNGNVDPWHYLSVKSDPSPSSPLLLINGTAHCADLYRADERRDLPQLTMARQKVVYMISQFLKS